MTRVYSVRRLHHDTPFTVIDDIEAEYYRNAGFLVDESIIKDGSAAYVVLVVAVLIAGFALGWYLFGFADVATVYAAFGFVYAWLWVIGMRRGK